MFAAGFEKTALKRSTVVRATGKAFTIATRPMKKGTQHPLAPAIRNYRLLAKDIASQYGRSPEGSEKARQYLSQLNYLKRLLRRGKV